MLEAQGARLDTQHEDIRAQGTRIEKQGEQIGSLGKQISSLGAEIRALTAKLDAQDTKRDALSETSGKGVPVESGGARIPESSAIPPLPLAPVRHRAGAHIPLQRAGRERASGPRVGPWRERSRITKRELCTNVAEPLIRGDSAWYGAAVTMTHRTLRNRVEKGMFYTAVALCAASALVAMLHPEGELPSRMLGGLATAAAIVSLYLVD